MAILILINSLVLLIAIQHFLFLLLEMFFWTKPIGLKIFRQSLEKARASKALAANQGLYNGFLSAGLIWSLFHPSIFIANELQIFFFTCIFIAGVFGAFTVSRRIFWIQAVPALLGLILVIVAKFILDFSAD